MRRSVVQCSPEQRHESARDGVPVTGAGRGIGVACLHEPDQYLALDDLDELVRIGTMNRNLLREDDPMNRIANTPKPPYYAVIFTSFLHEGSNDYAEAANYALSLAKEQPGFLGYEGVRSGMGISVSYWASLEAIRAWKEHPEHVRLQQQESRWFSESKIRVCKVERDY